MKMFHIAGMWSMKLKTSINITGDTQVICYFCSVYTFKSLNMLQPLTKYGAFCTANRDCRGTKPSEFLLWVFFSLHCKFFTLPWQPRVPGGSSKTLPNTTAKEVHLARLLPGMGWPTLKPKLHNQKAELAWSSFMFHPCSHHIFSPQMRIHLGEGEGVAHHLKNDLAIRSHSAEVTAPSVAESQAFRTHTGTAGHRGHFGPLWTRISTEEKHALVH